MLRPDHESDEPVRRPLNAPRPQTHRNRGEVTEDPIPLDEKVGRKLFARRYQVVAGIFGSSSRQLLGGRRGTPAVTVKANESIQVPRVEARDECPVFRAKIIGYHTTPNSPSVRFSVSTFVKASASSVESDTP